MPCNGQHQKLDVQYLLAFCDDLRLLKKAFARNGVRRSPVEGDCPRELQTAESAPLWMAGIARGMSEFLSRTISSLEYPIDCIAPEFAGADLN
jgi:hypothetical protein